MLSTDSGTILERKWHASLGSASASFWNDDLNISRKSVLMTPPSTPTWSENGGGAWRPNAFQEVLHRQEHARTGHFPQYIDRRPLPPLALVGLHSLAQGLRPWHTGCPLAAHCRDDHKRVTAECAHIFCICVPMGPDAWDVRCGDKVPAPTLCGRRRAFFSDCGLARSKEGGERREDGRAGGPRKGRTEGGAGWGAGGRTPPKRPGDPSVSFQQWVASSAAQGVSHRFRGRCGAPMPHVVARDLAHGVHISRAEPSDGATSD